MRIKKLEIIGFKSFSDRIVLHFKDPITGVVGPNGCGKSNVVDAIRWCMGEQSAKFLRGKALEDVIFAGSDARGPAGMAEVSLTFENDGRVPIELLAFSEITVTRRLYRDGTSEYLLNNTQCRLRDITDFFLGTGIGTKAYSIIEQGKVGLIVSSKPEDRRFFIEEAAGITKYKLKKKAAEKKMDSARQNLLRVSDVVAEIEKQLGTLRRQAQKAERYKQYRAEVRDLELWSAAQRWLGLTVELRVITQTLADQSAQKAAAQTALVAREAEIATARLTLAGEERRLAGLQERLYELDNRIKLGEAENDHQQREATDLEEREHAEQAEIESVQRQLADSTAERERILTEIEAVLAAREDEQEVLAEHEQQHRTIKEELARVQRELDTEKAEIARAQTDIARAESAERSLVRRIEDLDMRMARLAEEAGRLGSRGEELRQGIAVHEAKLVELRREQERLDEQRETHEGRLDELKTLLNRGEPELEKVRGELQRRRSRHASLEEIHNRYEGFGKGTRAIMQHYRQGAPPPGEATGEGEGQTATQRWGVRGLVADVVEAPPGYELAVEAALGERLGAVVVDSLEVGIDGIEYLKSKGQGRSSFVPLRARRIASEEPASAEPTEEGEAPAERLIDRVRYEEDYQPLAEALLGDVLVVEDLLGGVDRWRAGERRRMVTREGETIDATGVVAGGSREVKGAGVLEQKRELRQLEELIATLEQDHAQRASQITAWREERQELETLLEGMRRGRHQSEMAILTHEKDLHRLQDELGRLDARAGVLERDQEDLTRQRGEATRETEELTQSVQAVRERMHAAEDRRDAHGRTAVTLIDRLEEAAAALTEFKIVAAKSEEKRSALTQARNRLEGLLRDGEARRRRLENSIKDGRERRQQLLAQVAARKTELVELVAARQAAQEELTAGRIAYDARHGALLRAEAEVKSQRAALDALVRDVGERELKLREFEWNRNHLEEQVADRWRVALQDELHQHHLRPPFGDADEKRLRELRELIDRMGEINLTAIDEYNALEARHQFLVSQKADLEAALGQLEEAIAQINRASRQRFQEVFDLVNAKFQELFPRLFRGGRAYLTLTRPGAAAKKDPTTGEVVGHEGGPAEDDLLESGVEILAQPPGKKNSTIDLLSGGEKALTAVSLIFAIFLVKPSPFCLLDEVDAPLDEANVGRFNDLVRAMTDRSQFIIITHNKRTMEIADTLYGVTMEQPGISKLVSVNLTEVGRKAA
ncbi:MAG TPA: chromosome segregation protein SMC [Polyangia bacterium]|nr:chromosome segregation protein SMC [Polyangia bacterium]